MLGGEAQRKLARELVDEEKRSVTIHRTVKESVHARWRVIALHTLRKHGGRPHKHERPTRSALRRAQLAAEQSHGSA